jgi:hypothetical protein
MGHRTRTGWPSPGCRRGSARCGPAWTLGYASVERALPNVRSTVSVSSLDEGELEATYPAKPLCGPPQRTQSYRLGRRVVPASPAVASALPLPAAGTTRWRATKPLRTCGGYARCSRRRCGTSALRRGRVANPNRANVAANGARRTVRGVAWHGACGCTVSSGDIVRCRKTPTSAALARRSLSPRRTRVVT